MHQLYGHMDRSMKNMQKRRTTCRAEAPAKAGSPGVALREDGSLRLNMFSLPILQNQKFRKNFKHLVFGTVSCILHCCEIVKKKTRYKMMAISGLCKLASQSAAWGLKNI
jgi:hypothetical protein